MNDQVLITNIQRFSVNDGPGFRTNVYLKGCPLRCTWCHNPETIASYPELYWKKRLCVQCGACLQVCPKNAIEPSIPVEDTGEESSTYYKIISEKCDRCMKCVDVCLYEALECVGKPMTIEAILKEVASDQPFYANSGGGMTLSGGEPTLHYDFSLSLLQTAKYQSIHVCLDTNGYCEWSHLERLCEFADIVLFDLKHIDSGKHKLMTGVGNELILKNLGLLTQSGQETWVRIPVVPELNDSMDFHIRCAALLSGLPGTIGRVDLLPFHNWCQDKYGWLGWDWKLKDTESVDPSFLEVPAEYYRANGIQVTVGGSGFQYKNKEKCLWDEETSGNR